eukprot:3412773-Heterocapsa_arctica.AAC.1
MEKAKKENEEATGKVLQELEMERTKKREEQAAEDAIKEEEKEKAERLLQEQRAAEEQEEKEELYNIRNHKSAEQTAPWCTGMSEEQMRHIIQWIKTMRDTDPLMQGVIKDDVILDKEEIKHGQMETAGHK